MTGGSGFLGGHVVDDLRLRGATAVPFARTPLPGGIVGDIRVFEQLREAVRATDAVVHLAASPGYRAAGDPAWDAEVNVLGTLNVLRAVAEDGGSRLVHASTSHVYAPADGLVSEDGRLGPVTLYGASKLAAETYVRMFGAAHGVGWTILRFPSVFGAPLAGAPPPNVVTRLTERALQDRPLVLTGAFDRPLDLVEVRDAAGAILLALGEDRAVGRTYNVAVADRLRLRDLAETVIRALGSRSTVEPGAHDEGARPPLLDGALAAGDLGFAARMPTREGVEAFARSMRMTVR
ncbi:MAG: NAD-dependent epimerase/dehydratase family protein [Elusimicrobia bacterium]|nr:NAD-dependent epimerase/dehydratase family protein [Elusimicrobiota bacterium]